MAMLSNAPRLLHFYGFLIDQFIVDYKMLLGCLQQSHLQDFFLSAVNQFEIAWEQILMAV